MGSSPLPYTTLPFHLDSQIAKSSVCQLIPGKSSFLTKVLLAVRLLMPVMLIFIGNLRKRLKGVMPDLHSLKALEINQNLTNLSCFNKINICRKNLLLLGAFLMLLVATSFGQVTGDYKSVASGNWNALATWNYYNGSSWVAATSYPGQSFNTGTVTIENGNSVTLITVVAAYSISTLTVTGTNSTLQLGNDYFVNATAVNIINYGRILWTDQGILKLPLNAVVVIDSTGILTSSVNCNNNMRIDIGTISFSACNGGGNVDYTFDEIVIAGGTINAITSSNSPICQGSTINLTGSYSGLAGTVSYSWSILAPNGTTTVYTSTNLTIPNAAAGTYAATLTVSTTPKSITYTNSETIYVTVYPTTAILSQSTSAQASCIGSTFSPISVTTTGANLTYEWYKNTTSSNSGGTLISGATTNTYTPVISALGTSYYYCIVTGTCGPAITSAVSGAMVVHPATVITGQTTPASQTSCQGGTFTPISVTATGVSLTYQWYSNTSSLNTGGIPISGATSNVYTPSTVNPGTLYYYCVVTGFCGSPASVISGAFVVIPTTTITSQSTSTQTKCIGGTFSPISVTTTGASLTYQWYSNSMSSLTGGTPITGATGNSYTPSAATAGTLYYFCIVNGTCGSKTSAVSGAFVVNQATVITSPAIAAQSQCINGAFSAISVTALGAGTLTYQWYKNAAASNSGGTIIAATTSSYTPPATTSGTLYYYCIVTGSCGSVTSPVSGPFVVDSSLAAVVNIASNLGNTICAGSAVTFTATPSHGGPAAAYQWIKNSTNVGTNSPSYTDPALITNDQIICKMTSSLTCATPKPAISNTVTITATPLPVAAINYTGNPFCKSNAAVQPVVLTGTTGGIYTAPGGLTINATTGAITPKTSTGGTYTVTYTIAASGGCGIVTATKQVTIISDLIWTGTLSSDWNTSGNWSCNAVPDLTTNVLIPNVVNKPILNGGTAGASKDVVISAGSSLTVTGNTLQIAGTITNTGTFTATAGTIEMIGSDNQSIDANIFASNTIENLTISNSSGVTLLGPLNVTGIVLANGDLASDGNLTLVSSATQTAFIAGTGTGNVTGNVTMQRYLPSGFGYKYLSSPFQSATVGEFSPEVNLAAAFETFYAYDENNSEGGLGIKFIAGWVKYISPANPLLQMAGYAANFGTNPAPKPVDATGVVNNGNQSITLSNNSRPFTKGFNLVGNPYPSPIDWDQATDWTRTNVDKAIWLFNATYNPIAPDQYGGVYSSYVNGLYTDLSTNTTSTPNIIPSMQGFFVHVTDPGSGTLGMTNKVRTTNLAATFKAANLDPRTILRFAASFDEKNSLSDGFVLYFDPLSSMNFENEKDALKMMNTDLTVPNMYSVTPDVHHLSISAMPSPIDSLTKIPLGVKILKDGWVNFNASDISRLTSNMHLYLVDAVAGVTQNLKQYPNYRFYLKTGEYNQRFTLVFTLSDLNKPVEIVEKMFTIIRSADRLYAKVNLPFNTKGDLLVTNMQGQTLLRKGVFEMETVEINPNLGSGIYVVTMITGKRKESEKILIRKDYE